MGLLDYKSFILNEQTLFESAMMPAEWKKHNGKYRELLYNLLNDSSKKLQIDPDYSGKWGNSIEVSSIENIEDVKNFVKGSQTIDGKNPLMKVGKNEIPLTHLLKTGQFTFQSKTSTDTDTKEGMVVYFYYNPDINILDDNEKAADAVNNINGNALHPNTLKKLRAWILEADNDNIDQINDWKSAGQLLQAFRSSYDIDRYNLLTTIRSKASSLTGLKPDNWCPGDFYLYDKAAASTIVEYVKNAQTIGELNLLFSDSFSSRSNSSVPMGSMVAVSLKQEQARLGRAKEYLSTISPGDAVYNLTKEELAKGSGDPNWTRNEIMLYQDKLSAACGKSEINAYYSKGNVNNIKNESLLNKLAAIKLAYYLLTLPSESPSNMDNNLLSILKFGLKQHSPDVNPAYFKIIGQSKGAAKLESIQSGDALALLIGGLNSSQTKLVVYDADTRLDILMFYYAAIGDTAYEIRLRAATTNSKQAGLEFEGKTPIGDISQDANAVMSAINSAFDKRSSGQLK
jgi:hypothetical protein